jgi:orotidine-5'-phosphate decarboxylase
MFERSRANSMSQYWPFSGLVRQGALRDRLIVSLDPGDRKAALRLVDRLARVVGMFKVGRALFVAGGPDFIREIRSRGAEVFLDLKFHDSQQKVIRAAIEATRLGAKMFDIHAYGPHYGMIDMMTKTRAEVARVCRSEGLRRPNILGVAMLAGLGSVSTQSIVGGSSGRVIEIARRAAEAGLEGVVTTPHEVPRIRAACGRRFIIVTSGVVTSSLRLHDGNGIGSIASNAADAARAGADYVVVGGPIWNAAEPVRAVREITEHMERGLRGTPRASLELLGGRPV